MRRISLLVVAALLSSAVPAYARPAWKTKLDEVIGDRSVSVQVSEAGRTIYRHDTAWHRVPASNQKLLLSMALLGRFGASARIPTRLMGGRARSGQIDGNVWIVGRGDPALSARRGYVRSLRVRPTYLGGLARSLAASGVERIGGRVIGHTGPFARDWWAPGWKESFPREEIPLPTALSIDGNTLEGDHLRNPERRAALVLTRKLERAGIEVAGRPRSGRYPGGKRTLATVRSAPLIDLLRHMNRVSSNFFAEVLGKKLGMARYGAPGSIDKGADALAAWARHRGADVTAEDSSGLSYANRMRPRDLADLLDLAEGKPWGTPLRWALPGPDQGTLEDRLAGVDVRAKTGTLTFVSSLSGWVRLESTGAWAEFSIMSSGMYKETAAAIEDRVVRSVARHGP